MTTQSDNTPIARYARASLIAQRYAAARQAVPVHIMRELQEIEMQARAVLSPGQMAVAVNMVGAEQRRLLQTEAAGRAGLQSYRAEAQNALASALRDRGAARLSDVSNVRERNTGKLLGGDQMTDALTEHKYVIPGRERVSTRVAGSMGAGATPANAQALANRAAELLDDSAAMERFLDENVGPDIVERNAEVRKIKRGWLEYELQRRAEEKMPAEAFKPKEVALDDQEQRRMAILNEISRYEGGHEWLRGEDDGAPPIDGGGPAADVRAAIERHEPTDKAVDDAQAVVDEINEALDP